MKKEITVKKTISKDTRFSLPENIKRIDYEGKILVVSPNTGNWLVLENEEQYTFLKLLESQDLCGALDKFDGEYDNAQYTVTQIVAKDFENRNTKSKNYGGSMQLYLTNECNMRCPHCYMFAGKKKEHELTTDEIFDIIKTFKEHDGNTIVFSGGEIALRKDLYDILQYSHAIGISNEILTNGTLWTEAMVHKIAPLINRVQISIDGYNEAINSRIRGKGGFDKALRTVGYFYQSQIDTEVSVTPYLDSRLEQNQQYYIEFARSLNNKYPRGNFLVKFSFDILNGRDIHVNEEEKSKYQAIVTKIYSELYGDFVEKPFIELHKHGGIEENCDYGNIAISAEGDVCLCPIIPEMQPIGNIRDCGLDKLLGIASEARKLSNIDNLSPCKDCEIKYICGGGCRVRHFSGFKGNQLSQIAVAQRTCSQKHKNKYYDMMLRLDKELYRL